MRYLRHALLSAALGICLVGCGARNEVVGKWSGSLPGPQGMSVVMTAEFRPDGTDTQTVTGAGMTVTMQATYTTKDGIMTQTPTSAVTNGRSVPVTGKSESFPYKVEGDTLTLSKDSNSPKLTLKRVPEGR